MALTGATAGSSSDGGPARAPPPGGRAAAAPPGGGAARNASQRRLQQRPSGSSDAVRGDDARRRPRPAAGAWEGFAAWARPALLWLVGAKHAQGSMPGAGLRQAPRLLQAGSQPPPPPSADAAAASAVAVLNSTFPCGDGNSSSGGDSALALRLRAGSNGTLLGARLAAVLPLGRASPQSHCTPAVMRAQSMPHHNPCRRRRARPGRAGRRPSRAAGAGERCRRRRGRNRAAARVLPDAPARRRRGGHVAGARSAGGRPSLRHAGARALRRAADSIRRTLSCTATVDLLSRTQHTL